MKQNTTLAPNLLRIIGNIERDRALIASLWVTTDSVNTIFKSYEISSKKFVSGFGIPIIEYFIAVVREEKLAGDCPVMSKLVNFLLEKNITPKDVFNICMGLRKRLVAYLLKNKLIKDNELEAMDEIALLFDANLSGVLDIFTTFYQKQQSKIQESLVQDKKFKHILKIINFIHTKIIIVQNARVILGNKSFFNTFGIENIKELYEKYENGLCFMQEIDCKSNSYNTAGINTWLQKIHEDDKPFKTNIYNQKYNKVFTYSCRVTALPDTNPTQYVLAFNNIALHLQEDEQEIKERLTRDELTGLHNDIEFEHILASVKQQALKEGVNLAIAIVDIPYFKDANKKQNHEAENKVIIKIAKNIQQLSKETMSVAKLEGNRFGILMQCETEQNCYDWCCALHMLISKKAKHVTIALTGINLTETVHRIQIRAFDMVDIANALEKDSVYTDFENIRPYDLLPDQEKFTDRLKNLTHITTSFFYKELIVLANNKLVSIDKHDVSIILSDKQRSIAKTNDSIYVDFPSLGYVKASVKSIDTQKRLAVVHQFSVEKSSPLNRKKFRITAKENTHVRILSKGLTSEGSVLNMNDEYIALYVKRINNLQESALVAIEFIIDLDVHLKSFSTNATITKIDKTKDGYKIVLYCLADDNNKNILTDYIAKRQMEIIRELQKKANLIG